MAKFLKRLDENRKIIFIVLLATVIALTTFYQMKIKGYALIESAGDTIVSQETIISAKKSNDPSAVNVFINVDDSWVCVGNVSKTNFSSSNVESTVLNSLVNKGALLSSSEYDLFCKTDDGFQLLNEDEAGLYNVDSETAVDVYMTTKVGPSIGEVINNNKLSEVAYKFTAEQIEDEVVEEVVEIADVEDDESDELSEDEVIEETEEIVENEVESEGDADVEEIIDSEENVFTIDANEFIFDEPIDESLLEVSLAAVQTYTVNYHGINSSNDQMRTVNNDEFTVSKSSSYYGWIINGNFVEKNSTINLADYAVDGVVDIYETIRIRYNLSGTSGAKRVPTMDLEYSDGYYYQYVTSQDIVDGNIGFAKLSEEFYVQGNQSFPFSYWLTENSYYSTNVQYDLGNNQISQNDLLQLVINGQLNLLSRWGSFQNNRTVNFYIVKNNNVLFDAKPNNYTSTVWTSQVYEKQGGEGTGTGTSDGETEYLGKSDYYTQSNIANAYSADNEIRTKTQYVTSGSNNFIYQIMSFPSDEQVFEVLKTGSDANTQIEIGDSTVYLSDLSTENYVIRWYVFKLDASNKWHVDGRIYRKEGKLAITKTFEGDSKAIEAIKNSFRINVVESSPGVDTQKNQILYISGNYTNSGNNVYVAPSSVDGNTYTWMVDIKYLSTYNIYESDHIYTDTENGINYNVVTDYKVTDEHYSSSYTNQGNISGKTTVGSKNITSIITSLNGVNNYSGNAYAAFDKSYWEKLQLDLTNTYTPVTSISIMKEDYITHNLLSGAGFKVYEANSNFETIGDPVKFTYSNGSYVKDDNGSELIVSSNNQNIVIDGLSDGKSVVDKRYVIVETQFVNGYEESSVVVKLEPNPNTNYKTYRVVSTNNSELIKVINDTNVEVFNKSKTVPFNINKVWVNDIDVSGITVEIKLNGKNISEYSNIDLIKTGINNDGQVTITSSDNWRKGLSALPLYIDGKVANYTISEVAVDGHKLDEFIVTSNVSIDENNSLISGTIYNKVSGLLTINKIGKNSIVALNGVEFEIYEIDSEGNKVGETVDSITITNGYGSANGLDYDKVYMLVETKASDGYYLDNEPVYFKLVRNEDDIKGDSVVLISNEDFETVLDGDETIYGLVEVVNSETSSLLKITNIPHSVMPKAGGMGTTIFYIVGLGLMAGAMMFIIYFKRKN